MIISTVWIEEIPAQIPTGTKDDIEKFLELLDFFDDHSIENYLDEQSIYEDMAFCDWIYSKETPALNDMKKEISKKMCRYHHVDKEQLRKLEGNIGKDIDKRWVGIDFQEEVDFYAYTLKKFYKICRCYLTWDKRSEFMKDLPFCYPDIYFDPSVQGSIHTLNRRFEDVRKEIAEHLTALNDYKDKFLQLSKENASYREISERFQMDSGIECSPQAGRQKVAGLKREYLNEIENRSETVNCELHTKFKKFNIDREKQDRIYFAPAKEGIQDGKVVVVHIGKHQ